MEKLMLPEYGTPTDMEKLSLTRVWLSLTADMRATIHWRSVHWELLLLPTTQLRDEIVQTVIGSFVKSSNHKTTESLISTTSLVNIKEPFWNKNKPLERHKIGIRFIMFAKVFSSIDMNRKYFFVHSATRTSFCLVENFSRLLIATMRFESLLRIAHLYF